MLEVIPVHFLKYYLGLTSSVMYILVSSIRYSCITSTSSSSSSNSEYSLRPDSVRHVVEI